MLSSTGQKWQQKLGSIWSGLLAQAHIVARDIGGWGPLLFLLLLFKHPLATKSRTYQLAPPPFLPICRRRKNLLGSSCMGQRWKPQAHNNNSLTMFAKEVNQYWNANNKFRGGGSIHSKSSLDRDLFHQTDLNLNVTTEQKLQCTVLSGSNMSFAVIYQNVAIVVCQH